MSPLRPKKAIITLGLALVGAAYFGAWSTLETQFFLKSLAILLPVQLGGTLYLLYLYWTGRIPGTLRHQQKHKRPSDPV